MAEEELNRADEQSQVAQAGDAASEPVEATLEPSEPTMAQMTADLVRRRTKNDGKLTPVTALAYEGTMLTPEQRDQLVAEIEADETCADIKILRVSRGDIFMYSTALMSDTYARILLRAEEDNPYQAIAETVREESETYPRPTPVNTFKNPIFKMNPDQVEQFAREIVQLPEYSDIKLLTATTGVLYLYSERHIGHDHAESLMEWEEVGKYRSL